MADRVGSAGSQGPRRTGSEESDYVRKNLGPLLVNAMTEIASKRPRDPIEFLAKYLYHSADLERQSAVLSQREEELRVALEHAETCRLQEAMRYAEQKRLMQEAAQRRREAEEEARRRVHMLEAMRRRSEKEWRTDIMAYSEPTSQVVSLEGVRKLLGKANPDYESKTDDELLEEVDTNQDGQIDYEEMREFLQSRFDITVAEWGAGHVPALGRLAEEEEAAGEAVARDENGQTELHRWAAATSTNAPEQLKQLLADSAFNIMERDSEGRTVRDLITTEAGTQQALDLWLASLQTNESLESIDQLVLKGNSMWPSWADAPESEDDDVTLPTAEVLTERINKLQTAVTDCFATLLDGDVAKIEQLLAADKRLLGAWNAEGLGLGHVAAQSGNAELLKFLKINHGTVMSSRDAYGRTVSRYVETLSDEDLKETVIRALAEQTVTIVDPEPVEPEGEEAEVSQDAEEAEG